VTEPTTVYTPTTGISNVNSNDFKANIFPNPTNDFIAVQVMGLNKENLKVELFDEAGKLIQTSSITAGATNTYLDTRTLYSGNYLVKISGGSEGSRTQTLTTKKVVVQK
jgi:hypothetical protein